MIAFILNIQMFRVFDLFLFVIYFNGFYGDVYLELTTKHTLIIDYFKLSLRSFKLSLVYAEGVVH